ncbi:hypothetical protein J6590_026539 [Homalodisca vitripennis]|nr:hypothetical protein J6590_026539 [Homalodisca vitripennis]
MHLDSERYCKVSHMHEPATVATAEQLDGRVTRETVTMVGYARAACAQTLPHVTVTGTLLRRFDSSDDLEYTEGEGVVL